jgi:hypothetical protein
VTEKTLTEAPPNGDIEGTGQELVPATPAPPPSTVFGTDDPMEIMERTAKVANGLKQFVVKQGLSVKIQGNDYLLAEAWEMLGIMIGCTPVNVSCEPVTDHQGKAGWEAVTELRDRTGRVIGAARARCTRSESRWAKADDNHVESMAQTRAASKAFRSVFGFIAKAAGYVPTPAEEMPAEQAPAKSDPPKRKLKLTKGQQKNVLDWIAKYTDAGLDMNKLNLRLVQAGAEDNDDDDLEKVIAGLDRELGKALFVWLDAEVTSAAEASS